LKHGQGDYESHQNDGLRSRKSHPHMDKTIEVGLIDHDGGRISRASLRDRMDDSKGLKEREDHIHDEEKKGDW
jgi:hypothetical protein